MSRYVIGTRGSVLALWQAHAVERAVLAAEPAAEVEVRVISTTGDRVIDKPLEQIGDKGLFTKELEVALLEGEVDLCVHSMKDVPAELPGGCRIGAMLARADVRDVLVCGPRIRAASLSEVPAGARLGTGSLRRTAQLLARYPHIQPVPIRGNVDTRLAKAEGPDYEGVVLAAAGVERMGARDRIACYLPIAEMLPAAGQGAVGVEVREGDVRLAELCLAIDDAPTSRCVSAERRILAALEGGCQVPAGVYARYEGSAAVVDAAVFSPDGAQAARACVRVADGDVRAAADRAIDDLARAGARKILDAVRREDEAS